jgi:hypothetical protein
MTVDSSLLLSEIREKGTESKLARFPKLQWTLDGGLQDLFKIMGLCLYTNVYQTTIQLIAKPSPALRDVSP